MRLLVLPLSSQFLGYQNRLQMGIVLLQHSNRGNHLFRKLVNAHITIGQSQRGVRMSQGIERAILAMGLFNRPCSDKNTSNVGGQTPSLQGTKPQGSGDIPVPIDEKTVHRIVCAP